MKKLIYITKLVSNIFLEILFPSRCLKCRKMGEIVCRSCVDELKQTERQTEDGIISVYDYRDPVIKDMIWKLKYHHTFSIGEKLGKLLYEMLLEEIQEISVFSQGSPIYVIPVPISRERQKNRGYNQSEIIAKSFCKSTEEKIFKLKKNIVYKNINTIPQAKLTNRNKRLKNIKGAFEINSNETVKGKTIIIIDDVTTTGGTILEIMKLLKKAGAKKVVGFAVAH